MMMGRGKNQIARKSPEPVGKDWSPEQRKIFAWFESGAGNLIVRARAGTGKTTTIIEGAQRAPETRILLAAFNKSIQKELEARIKSPNVARDMMIESAGPSDFILSRANAPLIKICLAILRQNKRAIVRGRDLGKGIKSLVSRQKASDLPALLGLLVEWKHREYKKASRLPEKKMAARLDYVDDQYAVVESLADDCDSLSDLKAKLDDLFSDNNVDNSVICSTVHKSKGLESSNVFLLEDTFFRRKPKDEDEQHEEENIMYVAVTRSKGRLVYVSTEERRV